MSRACELLSWFTALEAESSFCFSSNWKVFFSFPTFMYFFLGNWIWHSKDRPKADQNNKWSLVGWGGGRPCEIIKKMWSVIGYNQSVMITSNLPWAQSSTPLLTTIVPRSFSVPGGYILRGIRSSHSRRPIHSWTVRIEILYILSSQHFLSLFPISKSEPSKNDMDGSNASSGQHVILIRHWNFFPHSPIYTTTIAWLHPLS